MVQPPKKCVTISGIPYTVHNIEQQQPLQRASLHHNHHHEDVHKDDHKKDHNHKMTLIIKNNNQKEKG